MSGERKFIPLDIIMDLYERGVSLKDLEGIDVYIGNPTKGSLHILDLMKEKVVKALISKAKVRTLNLSTGVLKLGFDNFDIVISARLAEDTKAFMKEFDVYVFIENQRVADKVFDAFEGFKFHVDAETAFELLVEDLTKLRNEVAEKLKRLEEVVNWFTKAWKGYETDAPLIEEDLKKRLNALDNAINTIKEALSSQ